jgi:hypothetical protein
MQMSSKSEEHANAKRETQSKVKVLVSAKPGMLRIVCLRFCQALILLKL